MSRILKLSRHRRGFLLVCASGILTVGIGQARADFFTDVSSTESGSIYATGSYVYGVYPNPPMIVPFATQSSPLTSVNQTVSAGSVSADPKLGFNTSGSVPLIYGSVNSTLTATSGTLTVGTTSVGEMGDYNQLHSFNVSASSALTMSFQVTEPGIYEFNDSVYEEGPYGTSDEGNNLAATLKISGGIIASDASDYGFANDVQDNGLLLPLADMIGIYPSDNTGFYAPLTPGVTYDISMVASGRFQTADQAPQGFTVYQEPFDQSSSITITNITAVPEPVMGSLLAFAGVAALGRRHRRRGVPTFE